MIIERKIFASREFLIIIALVISFIAICSNVQGQTNYYFSSSKGDDSRTTTQAQNSTTPWQTINKLNSFFKYILPGDSILFKRGETFYGSLEVMNSGTTGNPIVLGAFGTGHKPVISGFSKISEWTSLGNNIYEASIPNNRKTVKCIAINGELQPIGRFPKASSANDGYLDFESHIENGQITDNQLTDASNWTGGEIVIRKNHWVIDKTPIISHIGNVINFIPVTTLYNLANGSGYFIQNHPSTLTQNGDWCYDSSKNKLRIFYSSLPPQVNFSSVDQLVTIQSKNHIKIINISFEGANAKAVYASDAISIGIDSCNFNFSGINAAYFNQISGDIEFSNNVITNSLNNAVEFISKRHKDSYFSIRNNRIANTGMIAGMGESGDGNYKALVVTAENGATVEYNSITNTGYIPLEFNGNNILIKNNIIDNYCLIKDDGAGIYTWNGGVPVKKYTNRIIKGNIVSNGIGCPNGTSDKAAQPEGQAYGIYMDNNVNHVEISDNTVYNISDVCNHNNSTSFISIFGNTFFNVGRCFDLVRWTNDGYSPVNGGQDITKMNIQRNIFFNTSTDQSACEYLDLGVNFPLSSTIYERISSVGIIDNNYYHLPNELGFGYRYRNTKSSPLITSPPLSLANWKLITGFEKNGKIIPAIPTYQLKNFISANLYPNGQFSTDISGLSIFPKDKQMGTWDNSSKISGSGSLRISFPVTVILAKDYAIINFTIGSVSSAKNYILRFSTLGTTDQGIVSVCFRNSDSTQNELTPIQLKSFGTSRIDHEFLIKAPIGDNNASLGIDIFQGSGTTYIDNIEVYEANVTEVKINDCVRLEINPTKVIKTVSLGSRYSGVNGEFYDGTLTLEPFSSKILILSQP